MASSSAPAVAATVTVTGSWGTAQAVPGLSGNGEVDANDVSCVPGGACYAVGDNLSTTNPAALSFIAADSGGSWGKPAAIPGLESGTGDSAIPETISCPAAGDCLITGTDEQGGFTQDEVKGTWGKPEQIPGLAALNTGGLVDIADAACAAPGYCAVTGGYAPGSPNSFEESAFVVDEVNYHWGTAIQVPHLGTLNAGDFAAPLGVACPSPKNCTLEGLYSLAPVSSSARTAPRADRADRGARGARGARGDAGGPAAALGDRARRDALSALRGRPLDSSGSFSFRLFVDSEANGSWQQASAPTVPGLTSTGIAAPTANLACTSAGNCLSAGLYQASATATTTDSFLLTESGGRWSVSTTAPATIEIMALACPSAGNCVAGGTDSKHVAVTLHQADGHWSRPAELAGATALSYDHSKAQLSEIDALACPSAGNCTAGGHYAWNDTSPNGPDQSVFVASAVGGTWSSVSVPGGIAALNSGTDADFTGLSCASSATCATVGTYSTAAQGEGAFLLAEIPLHSTTSTIGLAHSQVTYGKEQSEKISVKVAASGATPGGKVSISYGGHVVCAITLKSGRGSCTLSAKKLGNGTYHLVASYPGSFGFARSASKPITLKVVS
jgi:hypothetical protein